MIRKETYYLVKIMLFYLLHPRVRVNFMQSFVIFIKFALIFVVLNACVIY